MKGFIINMIILFILIIAHSPLAWSSESTPETKKLVILNWGNYMDPSVINDFEAKFNVTVTEPIYSSSDDRDEKVVQSEGRGYDVIVMGSKDLRRYVQRDWIIPLDTSKVPNLKYVGERFRKVLPIVEKYAVPYMWGTTGIIYRNDLVKEKITSWKQFYQPEEYLRGKIMVLGANRNAIGFALKSLGYSFNSEDSQTLAEVERLLLAHKPYVRTYGNLKVKKESGIISGKVWMGMTYNGDALGLKKFHPNLTYILPKEGGVYWVDHLAVMKYSQEPQLALEFVNFLHQPKIAARSSIYLNSATPNLRAKQFLPNNFLENSVIYPSEEALANSEVVVPLPPRVQKKYNTIYSKLAD